MNTTIRFKRMHCGRPAGSLDSGMGYGVQHALVQRGIAEFVTAKPAIVEAAQLSEPEPEVYREPKRRRSHSKEPD